MNGVDSKDTCVKHPVVEVYESRDECYPGTVHCSIVHLGFAPHDRIQRFQSGVFADHIKAFEVELHGGKRETYSRGAGRTRKRSGERCLHGFRSKHGCCCGNVHILNPSDFKNGGDFLKSSDAKSFLEKLPKDAPLKVRDAGPLSGFPSHMIHGTTGCWIEGTESSESD